MNIRIDDLKGPEIVELLREHWRDMKKVSPPESKHALDIEALRQPTITFWTLWDRNVLAGCGALLELDPKQGEIKSMRTAVPYLRRGVATELLEHAIRIGRERRYESLSLETGSMPYFEPARKLYTRFGFKFCPPFSNYKLDPNSLFMTLEL